MANSKKLKITLLMLATPTFAGIVCYAQYKNTPKDAQPSELSELVQREADHQVKVTTFDRSRYEMPKANPSTGDENIVCKNGFGGRLPYLHQGMFNEPLYFFDAEKAGTDIEGKFGYAPFVSAYYVVGDILFNKPLDLFDRQLVNSRSLHRNFSKIQIISEPHTVQNSYAAMESKYGFPHAYLAQQAGGVVSFTAFNDACEKGVAQKNISYKKVDLSGLPISSILSANYNTTLHHGANGLYNFTEKTTNFVSENFLDWIQSNNRAYQSILNELDRVKFAKGSYLYLPTEYQNVKEVVYIDFNLPIHGFNEQQWREDIASQNNLALDEVEFAEEHNSGIRYLKPFMGSTMQPLGEHIAAHKDGKWFVGKWELPNSTTLTGNEPYRNQLVLMNETAMASAISLFKARYQGSQLDLNTENEDLELRYAKATSEQAEADLAEQKQTLLKALNQNLEAD